MSQLLWATDIHLDHVGHPTAGREFAKLISRAQPNNAGLVLTGDIAESSSIVPFLSQISSCFDGNIYFVLGNHDYYRSHFQVVDQDVASSAAQNPQLKWLRQEPVHISETAVLLGTGGWYDARNGDPQSPLQLSDFMLVGDMFEALDDSRESMLAVLRGRADHLAMGLEEQARGVLSDEKLKHVLVATHVPPFVESAWYAGKTSDGTWAPFFSSKATGDVLSRLASDYPSVEFTVLCGHTHGDGRYQAAENLVVFTGRATYGFPQLAGVIHCSARGSLSVDHFISHDSQRP